MRTIFAGVIAFTAAPALAGQDYVAAIETMVANGLKDQVASAVVLDAIAAQNGEHASLTQADIDAMDATWRAEASAGGGAMIDAALSSAASQALRDVQASFAGAVTEIFVVDMHGLNVAQSDPTSDYWQGDEAKFTKTYAVGPDAVFIDEVEFDESSQSLQSQVSFTLTDASGAAIGAATVGVNVEMLP